MSLANPVSLPARSNLSGVLFTIGVSCCFAIGAILAKLAYNDGANALAIVTVRTIAAFFWLVLLLSIARVPLMLPPRLRWRALGLGALLCVNTFGMYSAIEDMPAPLAVLTFCTHPILTALVEAATGRDPLTARKLVALVIAFSGLVLTLYSGALEPTTYGIVAASIASAAFTCVLVLSTRFFPHGDSRPRTTHMTAAASVIFLLACLTTGEFKTPATTLGWIGFWGVCISFPLALTGLFMAIGKVGASRASFLLNFEPIAVTIMSALFLGQALTGWQLVGGTMVIGALALIQWPVERASAV